MLFTNCRYAALISRLGMDRAYVNRSGSYSAHCGSSAFRYPEKHKKLQIFIGFLLISLNVIVSRMGYLISCPDNRISRSRLISSPPASSSS
jgi:hypothetical protein